MTDTGKLCALRHHDGSVQAWLDGWHVRFPADEDEQPTAERGDPPTTASRGVDGVTTGPFGGDAAVRYRRWVVVLHDQGWSVRDLSPKRRSDTRLYLRRLRGG